MTGEPPFSTPAYQVRPIFSPFVIASTFCRFTGASGTVMITAPFPASDSSEVPTALVAETLAQTETPHSRSNGPAFSVDIGIIHS